MNLLWTPDTWGDYLYWQTNDKKVLRSGSAAHQDWLALGVGFLVSLIVAFVAVKWLLRYIQGHRFTPFAIYRILLGVALLIGLPAGS